MRLTAPKLLLIILITGGEMIKLVAVTFLVTVVFARPQDVDFNRVDVQPQGDLQILENVESKQPDALVISDDASYLYAVDLSVATTVSQMECLKTTGYAAVFIRAFTPAGQGAFDLNSVTSIRNAVSAGLGILAYMTPQPISTLQGYQQLDLLYNGLTKNGISILGVFIQVTSPANWQKSTAANVDFINSIISRAKQYGLAVGIYSNHYDWSQITRNLSTLSSDIILWYWNVHGSGISGETPPNFDDFRAFGSFKTASVKQFAQSEVVCSLTVNRNVFSVGTSTAASKKNFDFIAEEDNKIVVGGAFEF